MKNQVIVKSFRLHTDVIDLLQRESKRTKLSHSELIRVALKALKPEILDKIQEVKELISA
ncbi:ribbon-helix-helix protein, CopG family [Aulosira sp. FACHB-615]|nr:ribbon-helix-helix protein, CopG family [Aulosira sp. FACHB-615]